MSRTPDPGLARQSALRTFFRIAGPLSMLVSVALVAVAVADLVAVAGSEDLAAEPTRFWMFFLALPFFAGGGFMIQAGYAGVAARYAAGETMPVLKESAAYLSDGRGVLGVGRTEDRGVPNATATGPFCRQCGVRNDHDARYCDGCGQSLA